MYTLKVSKAVTYKARFTFWKRADTRECLSTMRLLLLFLFSNKIDRVVDELNQTENFSKNEIQSLIAEEWVKRVFYFFLFLFFYFLLTIMVVRLSR